MATKKTNTSLIVYMFSTVLFMSNQRCSSGSAVKTPNSAHGTGSGSGDVLVDNDGELPSGLSKRTVFNSDDSATTEQNAGESTSGAYSDSEDFDTKVFDDGYGKTGVLGDFDEFRIETGDYHLINPYTFESPNYNGGDDFPIVSCKQDERAVKLEFRITTDHKIGWAGLRCIASNQFDENGYFTGFEPGDLARETTNCIHGRVMVGMRAHWADSLLHFTAICALPEKHGDKMSFTDFKVDHTVFRGEATNGTLECPRESMVVTGFGLLKQGASAPTSFLGHSPQNMGPMKENELTGSGAATYYGDGNNVAIVVSDLGPGSYQEEESSLFLFDSLGAAVGQLGSILPGSTEGSKGQVIESATGGGQFDSSILVEEYDQYAIICSTMLPGKRTGVVAESENQVEAEEVSQ